MEELMELLKGVRDDVDFENAKDLIDGKILTSFDIIQIIAALDDEYDLSIPATEIVPENFNSAEAIYAMVERLREG
ncbi:MAG: acyl carrier protein [Lachnospiraceae bacterium]|nr:acyl carrier protein [Lachnospiraceae bacterium]